MSIRITTFGRLSAFVATLLASLMIVGFWTGEIQKGAARQLDYALMNNRMGFVKFLLFMGTNPNAKIDSSRFCLTGNSEIVSYHYPLHTAAGEGGLEVTRMLLDYGALVNAADESGNTALRYSALYGRADIARLLLQRGAEVNSAAVKEAAKEGEIEIVRLLFEKRAEKNPDIDEFLCQAVLYGNEDVLRFLISRKADLKFVERELAPILNSKNTPQDVRDSINALIKSLNDREAEK